MIKKLFTAMYADENIPYFYENSDNVVFNCNDVGILNIDINEILILIIILMKMKLALLFLSDFWLGILN